MVFMVRLISGSLLFLLCLVQASEFAKPTFNGENQQTFSIERNTKPESRSKDVDRIRTREITDEDVENKVKPFKFSKENPKNVTSIKLKKSESYTSTQEPTYESSRIDSARSVDIDIEKYISPDFYNAVYTPPISTNTKDYTSGDDLYGQYGTEGSRSFENFGQLTTPRTPYFDKKYKEMVESVNQKLEVEADVENLTYPSNYTTDNFIENLDNSPNGTKVVYKIFENIGMNESGKAGGGHRDLVLETQTILSFERLRNETMTYDERIPDDNSNQLRKDNLKYLMGEENADEVKTKEVTVEEPPFSRTSFQLTTKKYSITKPPTDKNDAGIISNKIESDSLKYIVTTTLVPNFAVDETTNWKVRSTQTKTSKRGSLKFADYQKMSASTVSTYGNDQVPEQIYQENQIIPVHVASPPTEFQTTTPRNDTNVEQVELEQMNKAEEVTTKIENITVRRSTTDPDEQQSTTVLIIVQPDEPKHNSTESNLIKETTITIASTPRGFSLPIYEAILPITDIPDATIENEVPTTFVPEIEEYTTTEEPKKDCTTTEGIYVTEEATTRIPTIINSKTVEPAVTTMKYTTDPTRTESPSFNISNTEVPATIFSTVDHTSITDLLNTKISTRKSLNKEYSASSIDGETTSESLMTTEIMKDLTTETPFETTTLFTRSANTSAGTEEESTFSVLTETTTIQEQSTLIGFITKLPMNRNTESSTEKYLSVPSSTDERPTEPPERTTMNLDHTTFNEMRSSKGMKFVEEQSFTTEFMKDSTHSTDETAHESTTSIGTKIFDSSNVDEKSTISFSIDTTTTEESVTSVITKSPLELSTRKVLKSSATKFNVLNKGTEKNETQDNQKTYSEHWDNNLTTLFTEKQSKIYRTTAVPKSTSETINTDDDSTELEGPNGTIVAIVISCVGGVCLIALACLLIVMRNRQNRFTYGQRCKPVSMDQYSVDSVSVFNSVRRKGAARDSKRSYGNPAFEDPVCMSHPLNFPAISKFSANQEDVHAEFADIPQIVARTSELPEGCETKNRFANVIPLPESRVFLTRIGGYLNSDYINANYVTGPKNTRKYYIACQAPMSNTVDDFWRMIWEQQCKVILMLTHLFENGSEKCFDYLPPSEVLDCHRLFGDYQVTLRKREVKEKYIISSIQLKNMVSNSWREVTHFWYMGWPEKGVPPEANSIIAFLIEARSYMKAGTMDKKITLNADMNGSSTVEVSPVVVHCSPGTGRTGTVITCDIAIREFEQTRQVDIPKIVYRIRRDRASAVQTKEQYAFIYKVIALYATKLAGGSLESI